MYEGSVLTLTAYNFSSVRSHLCASRTTDVAPLPIANFWHTAYLFDKLVLPALDLESPFSELDFLLLPPDALRLSLGLLERRSFRLNLWFHSVEATDSALERAVDTGGSKEAMTGVGCAEIVRSFLVAALMVAALSLGVPDKLGTLLCIRLGAWLGALLEGALVHSLSEGDGDSTTDNGAESKVDVELSCGGPARNCFSRAERVFSGSLGYAPASGEGSASARERELEATSCGTADAPLSDCAENGTEVSVQDVVFPLFSCKYTPPWKKKFQCFRK
jgi:hypothetical protein